MIDFLLPGRQPWNQAIDFLSALPSAIDFLVKFPALDLISLLGFPVAAWGAAIVFVFPSPSH